MGSTLTPVGRVWSLLSVIGAMAACTGFCFPFWIQAMVSIGMTSFPGPEEEIPFADGVKVTGIIPAIGHQSGHVGAAAILVSMAGKRRIVLTVDKTIFEGFKVPNNFSEFVNDEVEGLLNRKQAAV